MSSRVARSGWRLALVAVLLWGCSLLNQIAPPAPAFTPTPTRTPFRLPPTFTPRPTPTRPPTSTPRPTATPTVTPLPSPTPGPGTPTQPGPTATPLPEGAISFGGLCASGTPLPCLYSSGTTQVAGQPAVRYVFENIGVPETLFVEINGVALTCSALPDYPTRAYCTGRVPVQTPIRLRLGWTEPDGTVVEVAVDQAVVDAIQAQGLFPLGP